MNTNNNDADAKTHPHHKPKDDPGRRDELNPYISEQYDADAKERLHQEEDIVADIDFKNIWSKLTLKDLLFLLMFLLGLLLWLYMQKDIAAANQMLYTMQTNCTFLAEHYKNWCYGVI